MADLICASLLIPSTGYTSLLTNTLFIACAWRRIGPNHTYE